MRSTGRCCKCGQLVTVDVDETHHGIVPPHGAKRVCPAIGQRVEMLTERPKIVEPPPQPEAPEAGTERPDLGQRLRTHHVGMVVAACAAMGYGASSARTTERTRGKRRFPVPR